MKYSPLEALQKFYGYEAFRPQQEEIINDVLSGKDVLVLMPTGGGKSICYQIPAICTSGLTLVISPLISLMKDQVDALKVNGIRAEYVNSSLKTSEQDRILQNALDGELDLIYLSPEKALSSEVFSLLPTMNINLIAIDEAHCISQWGHDFRPEYTSLHLLREKISANTPVLALTATADKVTRRDILNGLSIPEENVYISSFDRKNLSLKVVPGLDRKNRILQFLRDRGTESGIIYCLSRKQTEKLEKTLIENGFRAAAYHAGLSASKRDQIQSDFISDEVKIVCATIAFGMGIDKPNVRFVLHYNLPQSMEHFYQEIGRAGRDGLPSETVLMFSFGDVSTYHRFFDESENKEIRKEKLQRIIQYAQSPVCRRKVILGYFGENLEENCGNCDVCENPPDTIDGTVIAQKVLSAVIRTRQQEPINMIIDVLRGSMKSAVMKNNYHLLPTHGVGRDMSFFDWQHYIHQLIDLGFLEVEIDRGSRLVVTEKSKSVLSGETAVYLVERIEEERPIRKVRMRRVTKEQAFQEYLEESLKKLRGQLAKESGLAPYHVFGDRELGLLLQELPGNILQLRQISGFGENRVERFGEVICGRINEELVKAKDERRFRATGVTYRETWMRLKSGESVDEIAKERSYSPTTIYSHIAQLINDGYPINPDDYVDLDTQRRIIDKWNELGRPVEIRPLKDELEDVNYGLISITLAQLSEELSV